MDLNLILGILGMSLILLGFILTEFVKKWHSNSRQFILVNFLGAGFLVYYAFTINSWPFMILNGVWFLVAGYKLFSGHSLAK
mgnify:CR=1 FL=1